MHAGDYLRQCRVAAQLTQKEAGAKAKVTLQSWSQWERGVVWVPEAAWAAVGAKVPNKKLELDFEPRARSAEALDAGNQLRELREQRGWTQAQCAAKLDKKGAVWGAWESGRCAAPSEAFALFGRTYKKLAGRTLSSKSEPIKTKAVRPGGSEERRKEGAANRKKIANLLDKNPGITSAAIARALGISDMSVSRHRRALEAESAGGKKGGKKAKAAPAPKPAKAKAAKAPAKKAGKRGR